VVVVEQWAALPLQRTRYTARDADVPNPGCLTDC